MFSGLLFASIFVQALGVWGIERGALWHIHPIEMGQCRERLWTWNDSQIDRYRNATWNKLFPPVELDTPYLRNLEGKLMGIEVYETCTPSSEQFFLPAKGLDSALMTDIEQTIYSVSARKPVFIKAALLNTGSSAWYGYEAGLKEGSIMVRVSIEEQTGNFRHIGWLYFSDSSNQYKRGIAIGMVAMPEEPGQYNLKFSLVTKSDEAFSSSPPLIASFSVMGTTDESNAGIGRKGKDIASPPLFDHQLRLLNGSLSKFSSEEEKKIKLWIRNTSNFTWARAGKHPVRMSYRWIDSNNQQVVMPEVRGELPFNLPVDRIASVDLKVKAPKEPGNYRLVLSAVQEGIAWFIDSGSSYSAFDVVVSQD